MRWTVKLECDDCTAMLTYEDERPDWQGEGDDRYVECPSCSGKAFAQAKTPRLDLNLEKAFGAFRTRTRRQA